MSNNAQHKHGIGEAYASVTVDTVHGHLANVYAHPLGLDGQTSPEAIGVALHNEVHRLQDELAAAQSLSESRRERADKAVLDLDRFREQVREWVIDNKTRYSLCDDGVNTFFADLGLDPLTREYRVEFSYTVEATDEGDAVEQVWDLLDSYTFSSYATASDTGY